MKLDGFKVLFVAPDMRPDIHVHLGSVFEGIGYLSVFLKQSGVGVQYYGPKNQNEMDKLGEVVQAYQPDLIGFSSVSSSFRFVSKMAGQIKKEFPSIPTVCGGIHATIAPDEVIADEGIDVICIGEGEHAIVELAKAVDSESDPDGISGLWFKRDGVVVKNQQNVLHDFDNYPFPDWDLFHIEDTFYYRNKFAVLRLSRGCPYKCTYCCNRSVRETYENKSSYVRFRSPENAISYIKAYLRKYPNIETIAFLDDILCLNIGWFREFAELYKSEVGLPFACRGRANLFGEEHASLLKDANCYEITFGVESGNDYIRNEVLKRGLSESQILNAFRIAQDHGITTRANNMLGLPYETVDTIFDTIKLNAKLNYKTTLTMVFFPFKGTPLYDLCKSKGMLNSYSIPDTPYNAESILDLEGVSRKQINYFWRWFDMYVLIFKKHEVLSRILMRMHRSGIFPYTLMIWLHVVIKMFQKVSFNIKNFTGIRIKRYMAK